MIRCMRPLAAGLALWLASSAGSADTLREIYELALENDAQLKAARATWRADAEALALGRSALLPQLRAEGSYTDADTEQNGVQPRFDTATGDLLPLNQTVEGDLETTAWSVRLTQPLFDLPAWFSFQRGQELSNQAEAQFTAEQQELIIRVAGAYFDVLRAQDNLRAAQAEERATQRQLEQTQQRFEVGLIAITDVHEARAAYDTVVAQRLTFEGQVAIALEQLSVITGRNHTELWLLDKDFPVAPPVPADRAAWVAFALENNPSLKAALYGMEAARYNARSKRMEHLPKLSGSLLHQEEEVNGQQQYGVANQSYRFPGDADTETQAVMLSVTMPIFTGGYISAERRQAAERYNAALQERIYVERSVVQGARAQHIAVVTDAQRVQARAQAIVSAQSALDATQAGYEVGTRNIVDVLNAQRVLFASARDYANARYDYVLDSLQLKETAGTLNPEDVLELNQWLVAPEAPRGETFKDFVDDM